MFKSLRVIASFLMIFFIVSAASTYPKASSQVTQSPYSNQSSSPIRGLSGQEVEDLLNGRGAGYARMAELNNYPGPAHVLELKNQLNLSVRQTQDIETVYQRMKIEAKNIGQEIVEREQELSTSFASGSITPTELQTQVTSLTTLYGELRTIHLEAHLKTTPILSPQQINTYNTLRGYTGNVVPSKHRH